MMGLQNTIQYLVDAGMHPAQTVHGSLAESGREAIGCFPSFAPEELVYAAGFLPVGMWGGKTGYTHADKYMQSFACSVMRANLEFGITGTYRMLRAVLVPTLCDTLKCMCENWKTAVPDIPVIGISYPQNRMDAVAKRQLMAELNRIKAELEQLSGTPITEAVLGESLQVYDAFREAINHFTAVSGQHSTTINAKTRHYILKASYFMDKAEYTRLLNALTDSLTARPMDSYLGLKVVATGIMVDSEALLDLLDEHGITIVSDALLHESGQFQALHEGTGSALEQIAERYLRINGISLLYEPRKPRGALLAELVRKSGADAVIAFMMKFCDPEEFDYPIYQKELTRAGIPVLQIEIDQVVDSIEQIRTRLQTFIEMLI